MRIGKLWLFVILSLVTGFIWGLVLSPNILQCHLGSQIPLGQYDQVVSVDVIRNGDDIWIVEHKTGHLIFEYPECSYFFSVTSGCRRTTSLNHYIRHNRFKKADKKAFGKYEDLLIEILGKRHSELPR